MNKRRQFLGQCAAMLALGPVFAAGEQTKSPLLKVYKSRTCSCCGKWIDHMRAAGFEVEATNVADVNVYKQQYGVPPQLSACHTGIVDGYVIEGHVPADDIIRLLRARLEVTGIAVPGMPMGSPGMESPRPERYETLSFDAAGNIEVFAVHEPG
jgi:hypothetical protein